MFNFLIRFSKKFKKAINILVIGEKFVDFLSYLNCFLEHKFQQVNNKLKHYRYLIVIVTKLKQPCICKSSITSEKIIRKVRFLSLDSQMIDFIKVVETELKKLGKLFNTEKKAELKIKGYLLGRNKKIVQILNRKPDFNKIIGDSFSVKKNNYDILNSSDNKKNYFFTTLLLPFYADADTLAYPEIFLKWASAVNDAEKRKILTTENIKTKQLIPAGIVGDIKTGAKNAN